MRRAWAAPLALSSLALGCSCDDGDGSRAKAAASAAPAPEPSSDHTADIKAGDHAVVLIGKASVRFGEVTGVEGGMVRYRYGDRSPKSHSVERSKAYAVRADHRTRARAGDAAICKMKEGAFGWEPCTVKSVDAGKYEVADDDGDEKTVAGADVVWPEPEQRAELKVAIDARLARQAFVSAAREAGSPKRPDGYQPKVGETVLARFAHTWCKARVKDIAGDYATVEWIRSSERNPTSKQKLSRIVPAPTGAAPISPGTYVLVPPLRGSAWEYGRVKSKTAEGYAVAYRDGQQRTVAAEDVVPLVK